MLREADAEPIPGYRLIAPIGSGGFGEVWKCIAPGGIEKAIKFVFGNLNSDDGDAHKAEQERKALERVKAVRHPFVISMDRIEIVGGELAIVMELADKSLNDVLDEQRARGEAGIPRTDAIRYLLDAADGLDHLIEKHNLQHLDIKPRNLFLVADRVKVADFGLVKQIERHSVCGLSGGLSPVYAAPETLTGRISKHSDQYSLGIVYCELVSGRRPFNGKNVRQIAMQHMSEQPDLSMLVPADREAVGRALAKDPGKRFRSCRAFVKALAAGLTSASGISEPVPKDQAPLTQQLPAVPLASGSAVAPPTCVLKNGPSRVETILLDSDAPEGAEEDLFGRGTPVAGSKSARRPVEHSDISAAIDLGAPVIGARLDETVTGVSRGVLRPTLFIGLGDFGRRALLELRVRLLDRFGDPSQIPAFRFLYLDGDIQGLDSALHGTPEAALSSRETFLIPLQPVINYRRRMIEHLTVWLPREKLHAIPRSLQPQGSRALGRLAFVDNFPRLQGRLRRELQVASSPDSLEASAAQTGLTRGKESPRVMVFASACGGSSGATVDLGYALKRLLRQMNFTDSQVTLFNYCGAPDDTTSSRQELANAYATLLELNHFRQGEVTYDGLFGPDVPQFTDAGSPFDSVYLSISRERSPESVRDTVAHLATYVTHDVASPVGGALNRSRRNDAGRKPGFRSFGTFTVWYPRGLLLRVAARQAVARLLEVWQTASAPVPVAEVEQMCAQAIADPGLGWDSIAGEMNRLAHSISIGSPIEATEAFLEDLEKEAVAVGDNVGAWATDALDRVRQWGGIGTGRELDALWKKSRFFRDFTRASHQLAEQWDDFLAGRLAELVQRPGHRLATAEAGVRRLLKFCDEAIERQWETVEAHYQNMKRLREELNSAEQSCQSGLKIFGRNNRSLRHFIDLAKQFTRQRITQDMLEAGVQFFMTLRGRFEDRLRDFDFTRSRLKQLLTALSGTPAPAPERPHDRHSLASLEIVDPFWEAVQGTETVQVVLPAGVTDLETSAQQFVESLGPDHWKMLDQALQAEVLAPMGDLHNAVAAGADVSNVLGRPLIEQAAFRLGELLPITDVAQVECDNSRDGNIDAQLKAYVQLAQPSVRNRGHAETFFLVPDSEAGQYVGHAARSALPGVQVVEVANAIELTVLREQAAVDGDTVEKLMADARQVYQEVAAVPSLSPHSRFDVAEWRPLGGLIMTR